MFLFLQLFPHLLLHQINKVVVIWFKMCKFHLLLLLNQQHMATYRFEKKADPRFWVGLL